MTVSGSDDPQVTGAMACSFTDGMLVGLDVVAELEGELTPTIYEAEGTLTGDVDSYTLESGTWSGTVSDGTFTGTVACTADLDGYELVLNGTFTATLDGS